MGAMHSSLYVILNASGGKDAVYAGFDLEQA